MKTKKMVEIASETVEKMARDAIAARKSASKLLDDILHDEVLGMKPRHLMGWQALANLALTVRCGDRTLLVALQPFPGTTDWQLIALETVVEGGVESVLSDHAHKNLGKVSGMLLGIAEAEKYAAAWQARREVREEELRCDCGPIRKIPRAPAGRLVRKKGTSKLSPPQVVKGKQKNG